MPAALPGSSGLRREQGHSRAGGEGAMSEGRKVGEEERIGGRL